jgi:hypothetical protein
MGVHEYRHLAHLAAASESSGHAESNGDNRRRYGRLLTDELYCTLGALSVGPVLDLSAGGMRICSRALSGLSRDDVIDVTLVCGPTKVRLRARVAWTKRSGFLRVQVGFEFLNPDEKQVFTIQQMATFARRIAG